MAGLSMEAVWQNNSCCALSSDVRAFNGSVDRTTISSVKTQLDLASLTCVESAVSDVSGFPNSTRFRPQFWILASIGHVTTICKSTESTSYDSRNDSLLEGTNDWPMPFLVQRAHR
jgi:hypothetical protein